MTLLLMKLPIALLAVLLATSTAMGAPCARPKLLPVELPHVGCPTRVARDPGAKAQTVRLRMLYVGEPKDVLAAWNAALAKDGWQSKTTGQTLVANHGHDKVTISAVLSPASGYLVLTNITLAFEPG